jgi:hypothetical protein
VLTFLRILRESPQGRELTLQLEEETQALIALGVNLVLRGRIYWDLTTALRQLLIVINTVQIELN